jgi:hypothetical protein
VRRGFAATSSDAARRRGSLLTSYQADKLIS